MQILPGSARPVVSSRIWSKAPLRFMSFSIAAIPVSFMLQQRHPFASSRNSSDCCAGSSGEETLIVFAEWASNQRLVTVIALDPQRRRTFDILLDIQSIRNPRSACHPVNEQRELSLRQCPRTRS